MKKGDLFRIKAGLEGFGEVKNGAFAYKVIKNLQLVDAEVEILNALREPTQEYVEKIQTPIQELVRKYAETDEDGKVIEQGTPEGTVIKVNKNLEADFTQERDKILEGEAKLQADYELQLAGFEKMLDEDAKIEFITFTEADIPDQVSVMQLYQIKELLVD